MTRRLLLIVALFFPVPAAARTLAIIPLPAEGSARASEQRLGELTLLFHRAGWAVEDPDAVLDRFFAAGPSSRRRAELAEEFRRLLAEGEEQIAALRFASATAALSRATGLLGIVGPRLQETRSLARLHFLMGLLLQRTGEPDLARNSYRQAAVADPDFEPSPSEFPPEVLSRFAAARSSALRAAPCNLQVESAPGGARLRVDGRVIGLTPIVVKLIPGEHYLLLERKGYVPAERTLRACPGATLTVALLPAPPVPDLRHLGARGQAAAPARLQELRAAIGAQALILVQATGRGVWLKACTAECREFEVAPQQELRPQLASLLEESAAPRPARPWYKKWWVWAAVGAAVTTAVVLPVALRPKDETRYLVQQVGSRLLQW